ncbi:hypothetical protein CCMA1212_002276 [Trichoderma ghanense]|uniref:Uncharacterized protein n=1 Tax=Trichoderma ghanense TaxID=65468 RepID=A0ABY2HDP5_9HYPO
MLQFKAIKAKEPERGTAASFEAPPSWSRPGTCIFPPAPPRGHAFTQPATLIRPRLGATQRRRMSRHQLCQLGSGPGPRIPDHPPLLFVPEHIFLFSRTSVPTAYQAAAIYWAAGRTAAAVTA